MTDVNPFVYSRPLAPEDVLDREPEIQQLLSLAAGGHYVRLYAPRRFGKTSLLRKALAEAERSGELVPVLVDLYGVLSYADVTIRVERAYAQLKGTIRKTIESILRTTGLGLSLGAPGISVKLQLEPRTDPLPALHALLDVPQRVAERSGTRVLVALDEFQDIAKVQDFDKLLRSHIQHQGESASYIFCGSEPGMMRELFDVKGGRSTARPSRCGSGGCRTTRLPPTSPSASRGRSAARSASSTRCWPPRTGILSGRCCWRTGSGTRSLRARPPTRTTGRRRSLGRGTRSRPSSTRSGAGSRRTSSGRCAPSRSSRTRPTAPGRSERSISRSQALITPGA